MSLVISDESQVPFWIRALTPQQAQAAGSAFSFAVQYGFHGESLKIIPS